ncbi:AMP-binding protein [Cystobacter fuscus]|uniref:AMP-binding protein n=1 Tax=Cystobacter fuscus TaxID=43 RepID=UPI002B2BC82C|nr:fatty acyl-AMP ligase [Cystobacter fuscus]
MTPEHISTLVEALRWTRSAFPTRGYAYPAQHAFLSYEALETRSEVVARRLRARGLERGQPVGLLLKTGPQFLLSFFGVQRAGGVPVPLALTGGRDLSGYFEHLAPILRDGDIQWLCVETSLMELLGAGQPPEGLHLLSSEELVAEGGAGESPEPLEPEPQELAFIQYTSGSTAAPKGVAITHANAIAGLRSIVASGGFNSEDVFCGWLPHFHDMGLVGILLTSLFNGCQAHVWSPYSFIKDPSGWLAYFSQVKATIYTGPNFSYAWLCDGVEPGEVAALDLSSVRLAVNGAEAVDARLMEAFADKFAPAGLRPEALYPVYGLAEAVLAATFPAVGEPVHVDWVDRAALGNDRQVRRVERSVPGSRGVVALGRPVEGLQLRIVGEDGAVLGEDRVGEIQLLGPAVMRGYYRNPRLTAEIFQEGWLRTGDLGYQKDGRLYVVGRAKDVLKQSGESYYPEDIEAVVRPLEGVHRGGCVAFVGGPLGEERIICLAETGLRAPTELEGLAREIGKVVRRKVGLASLEVLLVKKSSIARTTSGKLQRHVMKRRSQGPGDASLLFQLRL